MHKHCPTALNLLLSAQFHAKHYILRHLSQYNLHSITFLSIVLVTQSRPNNDDDDDQQSDCDDWRWIFQMQQLELASSLKAFSWILTMYKPTIIWDGPPSW